MSKIIEALSELTVDIFYNIVDVEKKICTQGEFEDLSITEVHTIEAIGIDKPKKMSQVAMDLNITVGTLTIAINRLVKKGYVDRIKIKEDRRVVQIQLTEKGKLAYKVHEEFHTDIISTMVEGLEKNEEEILLKGLNNINKFLKLNYNLKTSKAVE